MMWALLSSILNVPLTAPDGFIMTLNVSRLIRGWTMDSPTNPILDVQKTVSSNGIRWVVVENTNGDTGPS